MGDMGQNYTIGNVYDWIGFVRKCVEKEIYLRTNNRFTFIASEWRFPRLGSGKHGHQVSDNLVHLNSIPIIVLYQSGIRDRAGEQEQGVPGSPEAARAHHCPGGGGILKIHIRSRH